MICAEDGGVLDDLVVYRQDEDEFLVIANAANTDVVLGQLRDRAAGHDAQVTDATGDYALVAIQGPEAAGILAPLAATWTWPRSSITRGRSGRWRGARPGWRAPGTPARTASRCSAARRTPSHIWEALASGGAPAGLVPAGLAARDTLRLEAGMPLYGNELGPDVTPFEAGLGRVVKFDKPGEFVGREALAARASSGARRRLVGLTIQSRRIARHGYPVLADGQPFGTVTSGAPSPTLGVPIAMAYLEPRARPRATLSLPSASGAMRYPRT